MADMRPYAERLSKAMPERFTFEERADSSWLIEPIRTPTARYWIKLWNDAGIEHAWAFWGPLAEELNVTTYELDEISSRELLTESLLEVLCEAVCQEAERSKNG